MTFVFPILLGGLVLAGIPVLLHLILRQKPKTLPFPAFRFLVQKHRSNLRKLQLRHLLLLALRMLLIAALCLALAGPRLFHDTFNLSRERPVAAVLIFDTSPTMDYQSSDKVNRLDEAKKRGIELAKELPDGSRVLVLDTADAAVSDKGDWLGSPGQVRQRIEKLKIRPANAPVTRAVEQALRVLHTSARGDDPALRSLPRLVCVFSDRTLGSWPGGAQAPLHDLSDQLPASLEGVQQLRASAAPLTDLLKGLRAKLPPPAGKDYPEQALLESIAVLRDRAGGLERETLLTDDALHQAIAKTRRQARELRDSLVQVGEQKPAEVEELRAKTLAGLHDLLRHLAGVHMLYLDVGVEQPVDAALLQLVFPRQADGRMQQLFAADEKIIVQVAAQALGKDMSTTLKFTFGAEETTKQVELKAGERATIPFELDLAKHKLGTGGHSLEVRLGNKDALESNNQVFGTFQVREPKRVLVLADAKDKAAFFARALKVVGFASDLKTMDDLPALDWGAYHAAYLFELANPGVPLWQAAQAYVQKGGNLAIVPGRDEMKPAAYLGQSLMPGEWKSIVKYDSTDRVMPGVAWNMSAERVYQHPLLAPFRAWFDNTDTDFVAYPRLAHRYWLLEANAKRATVIVAYADKGNPPALVERSSEKGSGKVVVFTTPIDDLEPRWNNYQESLTSFPLALALMTTRYLTGEDQGIQLNFQCGVEEPRVPLPLAPRFPAYTLRGGELVETLTPDPQANELRIKQLLAPENYQVDGVPTQGKGMRVGSFSMNLPPEEGDLTRVPTADVESFFGQGAVVAAERQSSIKDLLQGQWNEPLDLFPYLMILLLFVLALENLLANKFYRREE